MEIKIHTSTTEGGFRRIARLRFDLNGTERQMGFESMEYDSLPPSWTVIDGKLKQSLIMSMCSYLQEHLLKESFEEAGMLQELDDLRGIYCDGEFLRISPHIYQVNDDGGIEVAHNPRYDKLKELFDNPYISE